MRAALIAVVVAAGLSVALPTAASNDAEMNRLAAYLTKLAAAVDAYVARNAETATSLPEREVFRRSTTRDPSLLEPFDDYQLRLRIEGRNSAVLVCSSDGSQALIEDAGCGSRSDAHHWRAPAPRPCRFTLNLQQICN